MAAVPTRGGVIEVAPGLRAAEEGGRPAEVGAVEVPEVRRGEARADVDLTVMAVVAALVSLALSCAGSSGSLDARHYPTCQRGLGPNSNVVSTSSAPLTDDDLVAIQNQPWSKAEMFGKRVVLGRHNTAQVFADHPCSDVCPDHAVRIIHYHLADPAACAGVGGVWKPVYVPAGIGGLIAEVCLPRVIATEYAVAENPDGRAAPVDTGCVQSN